VCICFAAMSGGFSVPFTAAMIYFDNKYTKLIFGFLAIASTWFATYRIWKTEREQVISLRQQLTPATVRDVGIGDALGYVAFRDWGQNFLAAVGSEYVSGAKEYDEFLQALADGNIPSWGKRNNYGVHEPIPANFWFDNRIDWLSVLRDEPKTETNAMPAGSLFTSLMTSRSAVARYWPAVGSSGPRAISALRITFEPGRSSGSNVYQVRRTLGVQLQNIGHKALSDCKLVVESCDARSGLKFPITLCEGMLLAAGDHVFIPLVRYGEALDASKFNCADSFGTLANSPESPLFDVSEIILMSLRATGIDTPPLTAQCKVWVDNGRLHFQREWPRRFTAPPLDAPTYRV
jgi:hypothetical protein